MNEKAGTRDLDDSNIDDTNDDINISSNDDDEPAHKVPVRAVSMAVRIKTEPDDLGPIVRRMPNNRLQTPATAPRARNSRTAPLDLLGSITRSLDLHLHAARNDERSARTLQTTQILSLSNQLRDSQTAMNDLRNRLTQVERE